MAKRHGYTDDQLRNLHQAQARDDFSPAEKVAVRFAERLSLDPKGIDEAFWSELRQHYDEGEIVELAAAIGLFNYFNRFNDALRMQPTRAGEGAPQTR